VKLQRMSQKQRNSVLHSDSRLNLWSGSVRSGKTIASIIRWIWFVRHAPAGNLLMVGKTERTLRRNILDVMADLVGPQFTITSGLGECSLYGRKIYLVGANDERSESKIRGVTLLAAYGDEVTLWPESFFTMLLSRLSEPNAKFFGTTNPDNPKHWLKKNYIDRKEEIGLNLFTFQLEDNNSLPLDYINSLKREYTGLWYRRYILGLWVMAEGAIYPNYQSAVVCAQDLPASYDAYVVGCDYGSTNPFVYLLLSRSQGTWYLTQEHYYDSAKQGQRVNKQHAEELKIFLGGRAPRYVDVDPSRPEFILELRRAYTSLDIRHAINDVLPGIQNVANLMFQGRLKISDACIHTIEEAAGYVWDLAATEKGEDKPLKQNDHCMDALRYAVMRIMRY